MQNGLLYTIIDWILEKLKFINLVELFKFIAQKLYKKNKLLAIRAGVDLFIIVKWTLVLVLWLNRVESDIVNSIIFYLLISNIYTYFYYHTWTKDLKKRHFGLKRIKRRFLNLMLAFTFNIFSFAYLFVLPFSNNFEWSRTDYLSLDSLLFSIANSLTVDYVYVVASTNTGHILVLLETLTTFIFLTIILSSSIPQIKND